LTRTPSPNPRAISARARLLLLGIACLIPASLPAEPLEFNLPAQPADSALMDFCRQAKVELLFSFDELHRTTSSRVSGRLEPEDALNRILEGTGFAAKRNGKGRFVVVQVAQEGSIRGRLTNPDGSPARGIHVVIPSTKLSTVTDESGGFAFSRLRAGAYRLVAAASGYKPLHVADAHVVAGHVLNLEAITMQPASDPALLEPFVVEAKSAMPGPLEDDTPPPAPRTSIGDVDQPRSEADALDYTIFTRDQIARSGVISLNEFLQRQILDSDATTLPPEQNATVASFSSASTNLNFGGFGSDATIVLVNGRRLPEIVTALPPSLTAGPSAPQADVNVIPINLIERVEVLPVSASALYSGSPVGGVINIVLRPDVNTTELTTTYTNALGRFDAPQSTISLLNGETLLGGALHVRFNATFTQVSPPTESDLGFIKANLQAHPVAQDVLFRATPNVSSADNTPLFGPGSPAFTSVAPGADGSGGIAAFSDRQGLQDLALYRPPGGGLADSPTSADYPYGRRERTSSFFTSATYDVFPWLQVGIDATASRTVNNTGYSVFDGTLLLASTSAFNPFHQDVDVTLSETAPLLGQNYDEAHIDYYSGVVGLLFSMKDGWQASLDAQYGLSVTRYRGIEGVDNARWQGLVDSGLYNPLRDTQAVGPPSQFYDQAVIFYGEKGSFVTLGDYDTFDSSLRITNALLKLPTGTGGITLGGDYRYQRLANYVDLLTYGDGSEVVPPGTWVGRSLQRISGFGELQAPLLPARWLPWWIKNVGTDVAARYTASVLANEANLAPTAAMKVDFAGGLSLRASIATSNRFPPPFFSSLQAGSISSTGEGTVQLAEITDPLRNNERYPVPSSDALNPNLLPEAAVTQTAGFIYQRGTTHKFRISVDYVDTVTSGENAYLGAQQVVDLEGLFPQRVIRAPRAPGDPDSAGEITSILTGNFNLAWRHSKNWNTSVDYEWTDCLGGALEAYCRWVYFEKYDVEELPSTLPVDELNAPDGFITGVLRQRMNFGAGWSNRAYGFGVDGHYFYSRILPEVEWASQGSDQVDPYWQFDAYLQGDLGRLLPWKSPHYGLRGQMRIDNVFGAGPPKYADDPSGSGVQSYGDWRGRVYSLSITLTF
jgi:outer membrane receptor protein involved in Fe transport